VQLLALHYAGAQQTHDICAVCASSTGTSAMSTKSVADLPLVDLGQLHAFLLVQNHTEQI